MAKKIYRVDRYRPINDYEREKTIVENIRRYNELSDEDKLRYQRTVEEAKRHYEEEKQKQDEIYQRDNSSFFDRLTYAGRLWSKKLTGQQVDQEEADMVKTQSALNDLDKIAQYEESVNKYYQLTQEYQQIHNSDSPDIVRQNQILEELNQHANVIKQLNDYFKKEGRQSDVISKYMYDTDSMFKTSDLNPFGGNFAEGWLKPYWNYIFQDLHPSEDLKPDFSAKSFAEAGMNLVPSMRGVYNVVNRALSDKKGGLGEYLGEYFGGVTESAHNMLDIGLKAADYVMSPIARYGQFLYNTIAPSIEDATDAQDPGNAWRNLGGNQYAVRQSIIKSLPQDDPMVDKLYKGLNDNELTCIEDYFRDRTDRVRPYNHKLQYTVDGTDLTARDYQYYTDRLEEQESDLRKAKDRLRTGDVKLLGMNLWNYDVNGIPNWFEEENEQAGNEPAPVMLFTDPLNAFVETSSTVGMFQYQAQAIANDVIAGGTGYIVGQLPLWLAPGTSEAKYAKLAKVLGNGKFGKFVSNASQRMLSASEKNAIRAQKIADFVVPASKIETVGYGIYASKKSREIETGLEMIGALSERTMSDAEKNGADLEKVYSSIIQQARQLKFDDEDIQNMQPDELIKLALAYDMKTGDAAFDESVEKAKPGLMKLINGNNALAAVDYLQTLPFMNYSGKVINAAAKDLGVKLPGATLNDAIDNILDKPAKHFLKKDMPRLALYTRTIGKHLANKGTLLLGEGISEGIEEGQQEILQSRYKAGYYDDYNQEYSMFNVHEMFDNVDLAATALEAYFGLVPNTAYYGGDNIRKVMNIGFSSALMFSLGMNTFTNLNPWVSEGNTKALIRALRNDNAVMKLVGENYRANEDHQHASIFYDAFNKAGVNLEQVKERLQFLRDNVDEQNSDIKKEYIDGDIKLASAVWDMYEATKGGWFGTKNEWLKELGINSGSEEHKQLVLDGATAIVDADMTGELSSKSLKKVLSNENANEGVITELLDPSISEERKQELTESNPKISGIIDRIRTMYETYKTNIDDRSDEKLVSLRKEYYNDPEAFIKKYNIDEEERAKLEENSDGYLMRMEQDMDPVEITSFEKYARNRLNILDHMNRMRSLSRVIGVMKNRSSRLREIRKLVGLDVNTDILDGMVQEAEEMLSDLQKQEKEALKDYKYNTFAEYMDHNDYILDNQDELDKSMDEFYLNKSLYYVQMKLQAMYMMAMANPDVMRRVLSQDMLGEELSEDLEDLGKEYIDLQKKLRDLNLDDKFTDSKTLTEQLSKITKDTAMKVIKQKLKLAERRKNIAIRQYNQDNNIIDDTNDSYNNTHPTPGVTPTPSQSGTTDSGTSTTGGTTSTDNAKDALNRLDENLGITTEEEKRKAAERARKRAEKQKEKEEKEKEKESEKEDKEDKDDSKETDSTTEDNHEESDDPNDQNEDGTGKDGLQEDQLKDLNKDEQPVVPSGDQEAERKKEEARLEEEQRKREDEKTDEAFSEAVITDALHEQQAIADAVRQAEEDAQRKSQQTDEAFSEAVTDIPSVSDYWKNQKSDRPDPISTAMQRVGGRIYDLVSNTFFYQPDATTSIELKVNGENIFDKPLTPNGNLGRRLATEGWLESAKKYYVVSQSLESQNETSTDSRDNFTVSLIIEKDGERYAVTLKRLGVSRSERDGKTYTTNYGQQLIENLMLHGIDIDKITTEAENTGNFVINNKHDAYQYIIAKTINSIRQELGSDTAVARLASEYGVNFVKDLTKYINGGARGFDNIKQIEKFILQQSQIIRARFVTPGAKILTYEEAETQIENLRQFRNDIIEAYCGSPVDGKYNIPAKANDKVAPVEVVHSNGSINTLDGPANETNHNITNTEDISLVQKELDDGKIILGFGRGLRGANPFTISDVFNNTTDYEGTGLSGKIYMLVTSANGHLVPVMLNERRFGTQHSKSGQSVKLAGNFELVLESDSQGVRVKQDSKFVPSAAEILLYMICEKLNFGLGPKQIKEVTNFFINNGKQTENFESEDKQLRENLKEKQIYFNGSTLSIGLKDPNTGKVTTKRYDVDVLFSNTEEGIANRTEVVNAIGKQMHWNTDIEHMNSEINFGGTNAISTFVANLYKMNRDNGMDVSNMTKDTKISIFGCEELSFRMGDFFEYDDKGNLVKTRTGQYKQRKHKSSVAAWMIANGALLTNIDSSYPLRDPFVYANGISSQNNTQAAQIDQEIKKDKRKNDSDKEKKDTKRKKSTEQKKEKSPAKSRKKKESAENIDFMSEKAVEKAKSTYVNNEQTVERIKFSEELQGTYADVILFGIPPFVNDDDISTSDTSDENKEKIMKLLEAHINKFVEQYNKQQIKDSNGDVIQIDEVKYQSMLYIMPWLRGTNVARGVVKFDKNKGKYVMTLRCEKLSKTTNVRGAYQTQEHAGKQDMEAARKWLREKLGIADYNIITLNAVMRSFTNKRVFGVTNAMTDLITGELTGIITLSSSEGGKGVHYHEAWHYVNLLMHSTQERRAIYDSYVAQHPEYKNLTFREIEEKLAEEFREYVESMDEETEKRNENKKTWTGRIRNWFNGLIDFLRVTRNKSEYYKAFQRIQNGGYAKGMLDKHSIRQFKHAYKKGAFKIDYYVPGVTEEMKDDLDAFDTHTELYAALDSIMNKVFFDLDLRTQQEIMDLTGDNFEDTVLSKVEQMADDTENNGMDEQAERIRQLLENKELIKAAFINKLSDFGFKVKVKEVREENVKKQGDDYVIGESEPVDNIWDKIAITTSLKDNAATRTKIFLRLVPKMFRTLDTNGDVSYYQDIDSYGTPVFEDYNSVWSALSDALHTCESYGAVDENGNYLPTSIMGVVENKAKSCALFVSILNRLRDLDTGERGDMQLKSQIYTTFCTARNQISQMQISTKKKHITEQDITSFNPMDATSMDFDLNPITKDTKRIWEQQNDTAFIAARSIPKRWSSQLATQGFISYNKTTGKTTINEKYFNIVDQQFRSIVRLIHSIDATITKENTKKDTQHTQSKSQIYGKDGLYDKVIEFFHNLGIDSDNEVIDVLVHSTIVENTKSQNRRSKKNKNAEIKPDFGDVKSIIKAFDNIFSTSTRKPGSLNNILASVRAAINTKADVIRVGKNDRSFTEVFDNYPTDSGIAKIALAYNAAHPSLKEYTTRDAKGNQVYPINLNTQTTATLRDIQINPKDEDSLNQRMRRSKYCHTSTILDAAEQADPADSSTFVKLNVFTGIRDSDRSFGNEFSSLTPMESYFSKMKLILDGHIVFPTMSDKKTWYSLYSKNFHLFDQLLNFDFEKIDGKNVSSNYRFDNSVSSRMLEYFRDELESVIEYYSRENVAHIVANPNDRYNNYHGKVKDGKLQFGGNGGLFRYFYDVFPQTLESISKNEKCKRISKYTNLNLNEYLNFLYNVQQQIQNGKAQKLNLEDSLYTLIDESQIKEGDEELDGFELIRAFLNDFSMQLTDETGQFKNNATQLMNSWLMSKVYQELDQLSDENQSLYCIRKKDDGSYEPFGIPECFMKQYTKELVKMGVMQYGDGAYSNLVESEPALMSLIANHTINSIMSVIEVEKVFSGDPAFYKYKGGSREVTGMFSLEDGTATQITTSISALSDMYGDKIKRLGACMSPGNELRLDFDSRELTDGKKDKANMMSSLKNPLYSVLNVRDIECESLYIKTIEKNAKACTIINEFRHSVDIGDEKILKILEDFRESQQDNPANNKFAKYKAFQNKETSLNNEQLYERVFNLSDKELNDLYNKFSGDIKSEMDKYVKAQVKPYKGINVADAQVFCRPEIYRKIKIGLGEWDMETDEKAYQMLQNDPEWMSDPKKYRIVRKFQNNVLKMSYFENTPRQIGGVEVNVPCYNKMAIFPLFKYQASTDVGWKMYDRMHMKGNEIDMIAFESAVKVGGKQAALQLTDTENAETAISNINDMFNLPNDVSVNYQGVGTTVTGAKKSLAISIQNLHNLRMQLNTHAHEDPGRDIGTQMFKLAFSSIVDNASYGTKLGAELKKDIMKCINAITAIGYEKLINKFTKDINGERVVNKEALKKYLLQIVRANGLGVQSEEVLVNDGVISSLMARSVFEYSISRKVNSDVVKIPTNGGAAYQQSCVGFESFSREDIKPYGDRYVQYNDGNALKWNKDDNTVEVMLSMNFFKSVIPKNKQHSYGEMRDWLLKNNMIGPNAKPFGIGYRIPTQGMSSMFSFCVADVIPSQTGDTIIVPREFTAQTGSDFDIDKIYLATMSYVNGELEEPKFTAEGNLNLGESTIGGIANELLRNYTQIITDKKNYIEARGSIDVYTKILTDEFLDVHVRKKSKEYNDGAHQLLPSFQTYRKQEFSVGKDGIAPFALNVTNLALTQFAHLTKEYSPTEAEYGFGSLDSILGNDGKPISGWLSAMVNANVDVAKDPYVFDLNINQFTYKHANFLIRSGMGLSAFSFLAQPILKLYANRVNNVGGIYGTNLFGKNVNTEETQASRRKVEYVKLIDQYLRFINRIFDKFNDEESVEKCKEQFKAAIEYYKDTSANIKSNKQSSKKKSDGENAPKRYFSRQSMFDYELACSSLDNYVSKIDEVTEENAADVITSYMYQLHCIESYNEMYGLANSMSNLVSCSQIDTEKFGNNLTEQMIFLNKYNEFIFNQDGWTINTDEFRQKYQYANFIEGKEIVDAKYYNEQIQNVRKFVESFKSVEGIADENITALLSQLDKLLYGQSSKREFFKEDVDKFIADLTDQVYEDALQAGMNKFTGKRPISVKEQFETFNTNKSTEALKIYFQSTFLDDKLTKATSLTKKLLNGHTMTASNIFEQIFTNICMQVFGDVVYNGEDGITVNTFNPMANKESLIEVGNAVDNVLRYLYFYEYSNSTNSLLNDNGLINLTPSKNDLIAKIYKLVLGNKNENIFSRLSDLIKDIQNNPLSEEYEGLTDYDGKLSNELLLYLTPQTASQRYPIGRMLLRAPQFQTSNEYKSKLISAFSQLLNHSNDRIRQIAEDLVFYAYYSTYNQNTHDSFFDLVPLDYRKNYDSALQEGLQNEADVNINYEDVYDTIARNYYNNDNIVRIHILDKTTAKNGFQTNTGEIFSWNYFLDRDSKKIFPSWFISTKVKNGARYVKVLKDNKPMLYKKIGYIGRERTITKNGKQINIKNVKMAIYIPIPKAGLHSKGINFFELYCDMSTPSIFKENKLPESTAEDFVRNDIQNRLDIQQGDGANTFKLAAVYDTEEIPENRKSSFKEIYYQSTDEDTKIIDGKIKLQLDQNPFSSIKNNAHFVINLCNGEDSYNPDILKSVKGVVVNINIHDPKSITEAMKIIDQSEIEGGQNIGIYSTNVDCGVKVKNTNQTRFTISEDEFRQYLTEFHSDLLDDYENDNIEDNALIRLKQDCAQHLINVALSSLLTQFDDKYTINNVYSLVSHGKLAVGSAVMYSKDILSDSTGNTYINMSSRIGQGKDVIHYVNQLRMGVTDAVYQNQNSQTDLYVDAKTIDVEIHHGNWTRGYVQNNQDKVFLFGDNTNDRVNTHYIPKSTQAVIRGLDNAIGIDTKKDRGTFDTSYFTDEDFDAFKAQVDEAIKKAVDSGKPIVIPEGGIGTGKAQLDKKAPKLFDYLQKQLDSLVNGTYGTETNNEDTTTKTEQQSEDLGKTDSDELISLGDNKQDSADDTKNSIQDAVKQGEEADTLALLGAFLPAGTPVQTESKQVEVQNKKDASNSKEHEGC